MTAAHRRYVKAQRRARLAAAAGQAALLALLLGGWELAADQGWVSAFLVSRPSAAAGAILQLASQGHLWVHLASTALASAAGFVAGTALGVAIAAALWWWPYLARVLEPYLVVFNAIPKVALGPLFIVWLGTNVQSVIAMAIAITVVVAVVVVLGAFVETDPARVQLLRSLGARRGQIFRMLIVPSAVPAIIGALKVNVGLALVGAVTGEFLAGGRGLGYLIVYGGQVFDMNLVMASLALLIGLSVLLYATVALLERVMLRRFGTQEHEQHS
ncbi:ABC transporter permease [Carboxydochorda subterranea]|uniref:ABC transporter permease n=1 Tax=Carboxydichorda subterranea TaxID=3109565 RepID=A0ABZ1BX38_9FIRM|nr:ABC transporter permease [Limnochorda sp. L945t]WRP17342.1 ABC transporter permease [Limnochorda sp. L945t]